jgi:hypothetical protein
VVPSGRFPRHLSRPDTHLREAEALARSGSGCDSEAAPDAGGDRCCSGQPSAARASPVKRACLERGYELLLALDVGEPVLRVVRDHVTLQGLIAGRRVVMRAQEIAHRDVPKLVLASSSADAQVMRAWMQPSPSSGST